MFVRKCVEFVEREGLRSEGIYRVPGKKDNVLLLQDKYEESELKTMTRNDHLYMYMYMYTDRHTKYYANPQKLLRSLIEEALSYLTSLIIEQL